MKHDWEYKKLGEVASLVADGDWIESKDQSEDGIRLIQTGNIGNGEFKAKDDKPHYISEETFNRLGCTEIFEGDCLVSRLPDPVGRACIIPNTDSRMITAVDCSIIRFDKSYLPKTFVYYSRSSKYATLVSNNTTGSTRKRISRKNLESIIIPVPPLPIQEQIVSELDKVSEIIEKKKQQVKELDNLAQSIFYDMFGDPVENEKGWEMKKVIEVVKLQRGYDLPVQSRCSSGGIPIYGANGIVGYHNQAMSLQGIITGRSGSLGEVFVSKVPFWPLNTSLFSIDTHGNDLVFLLYLMRNFDLKRFKQGAGVPTLNRNSFHGEKIINVPLSLQRSFAQKIEAIEKQKELINQSIKEAQTLFDARMDYWFGE